MKKLICAAVVFSWLLPLRVFANDGVAAQGVGGVTIAKTDNIAIKSEVLDISCDRIHVSYDFINESDRDEDTLIMFPLPTYPANIPEYNDYAGQPADFTITVDGRQVKYQTEIKAVVVDYEWSGVNKKAIREVDVTDKLKAVGLSDQDIASFRFSTKYIEGKRGEDGYYSFPISNDKIQKLEKEGLLAGGNMGETTPQWETRVTYVWKQLFPAKKVVHVEHSYRPFTSGGATAGFSQYTDGGEFCLSKENVIKLKSIRKYKKNLDAYLNVPGTNVKYTLTTANSWKDGIRHFTLRLHPKSKAEVVSACFPVALVKTSDNVYQAHLNNFHPTEELSVYFGNARSCNGDNSGLSPNFQ
jgi:hypothetical protein